MAKKKVVKKKVVKKKAPKKLIRKKNGPDITLKRFKDAITGTGGTYLHVAQKLGVTRHTVANYVMRNDLHDLVKAERKATVDLAINKVVVAMNKGEKWATEKILDSWGREEGFGKEPVVAIQNNVQNNDNRVIDFAELYAEEYPELLARFEKTRK